MTIKATRVTVPEFEIVSNPTINISSIKTRRFNIIDRTESIEKLTDELVDFNGNYEAIKAYIYKHVRTRKVFDNLRAAIQNVYPEHIETLDKLLMLK